MRKIFHGALTFHLQELQPAAFSQDSGFCLEIDGRGAVAHYNLASVHSINKKIHPALGEIDAALAKGFIRFRSEVKHLAA